MVDYTRLRQFSKDNKLTIPQIDELVAIIDEIQNQILIECANKISMVNLMRVGSK